jgi:hypothetical protein
MNTGHAINVAQFKEVTQILKNLNGKWNPVNAKLVIPNLDNRLTNCQIKLDELDKAVSIDKIKTMERATTYEPLNDLVRRVIAAMRSCEMETSIIDRGKTLKDLIDGQNVSATSQKRKSEAKKAKMIAITEGVDLPEPTKNYSVSQLSYEVRLSNFKKIISLIEEAGNYATNQTDLSIDALKAFTQTLVDANNATNDAYDLLTIKRQERNDAFYGDSDSINAVFGLIKNELESIETKQGTNYKKVADFKFVKYSDS